MAKLKFVSLDQMAPEPVAALARKDYPEYYEHLEQVFATIGRRPPIGGEHDGVTSLIAAVAAGHGFAIVLSCLSGMAGSRLKLLKVRPARPSRSIVALWRKDAETESLRAFIGACQAKPTKK